MTIEEVVRPLAYHALIKHRYKKAYGLSSKQFEEEPMEDVIEGMMILDLVEKRREMDNKGSNNTG